VVAVAVAVAVGGWWVTLERQEPSYVIVPKQTAPRDWLAGPRTQHSQRPFTC
jgi:hypothetical protein